MMIQPYRITVHDVSLATDFLGRSVPIVADLLAGWRGARERSRFSSSESQPCVGIGWPQPNFMLAQSDRHRFPVVVPNV